MGPDTATSTVYGRRTHLSPSRNLPVELFTIILLLRFPDADIHRTRDDMAALYDLRLVSKAWKELIEGTPLLWIHVSTDYPTVVVRDCLQLSKQCALHVHVSHQCIDSSQTLVNYLQLLQPHSSRWRTLTYWYWSGGQFVDNQIIRRFLEAPAPILEGIDINLNSKTFLPGDTVDLAGGQARKLKHLELQYVLLPMSSIPYHCLETFSLDLENTIPVEEVVNLLAESPALRSCSLSFLPAGETINPTTHEVQSLGGPWDSHAPWDNWLPFPRFLAV